MTAPAAPAAAPKGRLGNGQLRRQVAEYLAGHPGPCKTGEIAKALGRSAGAVGNALTTLAGNGEADLVPGKPVSYQANSSTAAAAAAITPKAPLPPKPAPAPAPPPPPAAPAPSPAPKPAFTPKPAAAAGPVTRPNGQVYQPRSLADMPDVDALRRLRDAGVPALLYGPPGTGKTSLIEAAFPDLITVAGDGDTTAADLVGEYTQNPDGTFTFIYGPLIRAMQEGRVLFIDDATLISPAVLAVAYPAMDGRREITVKAHKGETIKAADGFYVSSRPQPRSPRRDPHRGPLQQVLGPGQGHHRLRPRPRPQDRPPRDQGREGPRRPAGRRRDRLGTPAPRAPRPRQGRRHPRRGRRHRQPGRHRPRGGPRRRSRRRSQGLRPQGGRPPRPRPPDLAPRPAATGKDRPRCPPPPSPPPPGSPPRPAPGRSCRPP